MLTKNNSNRSSFADRGAKKVEFTSSQIDNNEILNKINEVKETGQKIAKENESTFDKILKTGFGCAVASIVLVLFIIGLIIYFISTLF